MEIGYVCNIKFMKKAPSYVLLSIRGHIKDKMILILKFRFSKFTYSFSTQNISNMTTL